MNKPKCGVCNQPAEQLFDHREFWCEFCGAIGRVRSQGGIKWTMPKVEACNLQYLETELPGGQKLRFVREE